jgi:hypothetical protein
MARKPSPKVKPQKIKRKPASKAATPVLDSSFAVQQAMLAELVRIRKALEMKRRAEPAAPTTESLRETAGAGEAAPADGALHGNPEAHADVTEDVARMETDGGVQSAVTGLGESDAGQA